MVLEVAVWTKPATSEHVGRLAVEVDCIIQAHMIATGVYLLISSDQTHSSFGSAVSVTHVRSHPRVARTRPVPHASPKPYKVFPICDRTESVAVQACKLPGHTHPVENVDDILGRYRLQMQSANAPQSPGKPFIITTTAPKTSNIPFYPWGPCHQGRFGQDVPHLPNFP
jgi:hypothetical protein